MNTPLLRVFDDERAAGFTGLGGTLHAAPRDDGGFAVRATFPLGDPA